MFLISPLAPSRRTAAASLARRSTAALAVAVTTVGVSAVVASSPALADPGATPLFGESFANATTSQQSWFLPPAEGGNRACLTAAPAPEATAADGAIPSCAPTTDAPGSGVLRLTTPGVFQTGTAYYDSALATAQGVDVTFDTYQWGINGLPADGISFVLAATDPQNPSAPATSGGAGGAIGYGPLSTGDGVPHGYLGFGLDQIGNFANSDINTQTTCAPSPSTGEAVTVRGPGHGRAGYCTIGTTPSNGSLDEPYAGSRPAAVPVEVVLNPASQDATSRNGDVVPARSWLVAWTAHGAQRQVLTGALPTAEDLATAEIPQAWVNPSTGLPYQLSFGWTAATGAGASTHEIGNVSATTLLGPLATHRLDLTVSPTELEPGQAGQAIAVPFMDYVAFDPINQRGSTVTTTFPAGLTPGQAYGPFYACTTTGQVVTCTRFNDFPFWQRFPIFLPFVANGDPAGAQSITSRISSLNAQPATAQGEVYVRSGQAITVTSTAPAVIEPGVTYPLTATGGDSGNPVEFALGEGTTNEACTIENGTISFSHTGTCVVTATQAGGDAYAAAAPVDLTFTVGQATQAITVTPLVTPAPVGSSQLLLATGGSSSLPVTFAVTEDSAAACSIEGSTVSFTAAGSCVVTADQAGNDDFAAAPQVVQTVSVERVATATTVTLSRSTSVFGQVVGATVSVTSGATGEVVDPVRTAALRPETSAADGLVQLMVDGAPAGDPVGLDADGTVTVADLGATVGAALGTGAHTVTAVFTPTDEVVYAASTATAQTLVVDPASTTTAVRVSARNLTATVSVIAPGAGNPSGTVLFTVDGRPVGTAAVRDGVATLDYATPADKTREVAAQFTAEGSFTGSVGSTARSNPTITARVTAAQARNKNLWFRTPVTVTFTCTTSGAALTAACPAPVRLLHNGAALSVSRTIMATDGGVATVTVKGLNLDMTVPAVRITGAINGARYFATPPRAVCVGSDRLSGLASCVVSHRRSGQLDTITATATDRAGNVSTSRITVTVATTVVAGARFTGGAYIVKAGTSITLLTSGTLRPRYVDAALYPKPPRGDDNYFRSTGRGTWALGVTLDKGMRPGYWNIGVKTSRGTEVVRIYVVR